nr:efflux RND transporter periplasmic adaptor subunit [uncultured Acidocella sp.]
MLSIRGVSFLSGLVLAAALSGAAWAQTSVPITRPIKVQWRDQARFSAHLAAAQQAVLAPGRGGVVTQVNFHSGQAVAAGAVLVVLDVAPEQAQLALDQAKLAQAARALARTEKLMAISGASQSALEQAQAVLAEDQAQLRLDQATLAQGEIIAPFAGIAGIREIDPGDYLQAGQSVVTLAAPGPLKLYFSVPQAEQAGLAPGEALRFTAPLGDGAQLSVPGRLVALGPALDSASDARPAEGRLDGETPSLLSGMNGVVEIATGAPVPALQVPSTAVTDSMLGPYVLVLSPGQGGSVVHSLYVKILGRVGDDSIIQAPGLGAGQSIVALGGFRLTDGQRVSPQTP